MTGFLHERPLADLREELARLGIARRADVSETEDHVSALCEVMAMLVAEGASLDVQREFFSRFLASWIDDFADALERAGTTDFYKHVGRLARAFVAIERVAFDFEQ
jgi:TorA maturation chaperone TorD